MSEPGAEAPLRADTAPIPLSVVDLTPVVLPPGRCPRRISRRKWLGPLVRSRGLPLSAIEAELELMEHWTFTRDARLVEIWLDYRRPGDRATEGVVRMLLEHMGPKARLSDVIAGLKLLGLFAPNPGQRQVTGPAPFPSPVSRALDGEDA